MRLAPAEIGTMSDRHERLSNISTAWTLLRQAHEGPPDRARLARELLTERYGGAVRAYLQKALGDPNAADDLAQEFALGLVEGRFHKADPQRGRFRDYVKTVLFHLVSRHRRQVQASPRAVAPDGPELASLAAPDADPLFDREWREHLLNRAWAALAEAQPTYHAVLRFRAENPDLRSAEMAQRLSEQLGQPLTDAAVRQTLHRAREKFAHLLREEVAHSLHECPKEEVEQELAELELLEYCREK